MQPVPDRLALLVGVAFEDIGALGLVAVGVAGHLAARGHARRKFVSKLRPLPFPSGKAVRYAASDAASSSENWKFGIAMNAMDYLMPGKYGIRRRCLARKMGKSALHLPRDPAFHRRMIDMLVRLYDLPDSSELYRTVAAQGITLRRARAFEKHTVAKFARENFSEKWASEIEVAMTRQPVSCWIATKDKAVLGFSCYETTQRGFFGPTGVIESARGTGLGKALLFKALESLHEIGYVYGVIGGVGPREFYAKNCGAIEIPGSDPGVYGDILP